MSQFKDELTGAKSPAVVKDLATLAERTVDEQSGLTGKLIQGAYKTAAKVDSNISEKAARQLLPELAKELEPFWDEFQSGDHSGSFGEFLNQRSEQVSSLLLESADRQAGKVNNQALQKVYKPLRGKIAKIVEAKVPEIGEVLAKHVQG